MFDFLKKIKRKRILQTLLKEKKAKYASFNSIKSVGFAYIVDSIQSYNDLLSVINDFKEKSYLYTGFVVEKKNEIINETLFNDKNITILKKNELNFVGVPKSKEFESSITILRDIFISFNFVSNFTLDFIALKANTTFTIGLNESSLPIYTMVIHGNESSVSGGSWYLEQIIHYLKIINK